MLYQIEIDWNPKFFIVMSIIIDRQKLSILDLEEPSQAMNQ